MRNPSLDDFFQLLSWDLHLTLQGEQSGRGAGWKNERR